MSHKHSAEALVFGAEPRMDLLPPEVRLAKRDKARRRMLVALLLAVVLVVGVGIGAVTWQAGTVQEQLATERERTAELIADQAQYSEVQKVQTSLDMARAAREFGASTEIDWAAYVAEIQSLLPADVGIGSLTLDGASPLLISEQPSIPLQYPRVATITIQFTGPTVSSLPPWLDALSGLPAYADSQPSLVSRTPEGTYTVDWVLHINEDALSHRFATPEGQ